MTTWASQRLAGWGRFPVIDATCARPERRREVIETLKSRAGEPLIAHGLGRSYGDAALLEQGRVILTRRLNCMLDFDAETGWLRCEGGVTIGELVDTFVPRGFFPPVVPGTQHVTVAGALASDIHGKNHHVDGCWSDHVRRVEILTGSGDVVTCDAETEPELFWATAGGMGLTGLILAMEIQLVPIDGPNIEMEAIQVEDLNHFFEVSSESADFTHTVSWVDCVETGPSMGRGIFMRGRHAKSTSATGFNPMGLLGEGMDLDVGWMEANWLLNRLSVSMFNEVYYRHHPGGQQDSVVDIPSFFFPLDVVQNWNRLYGKRGFVQYQFVVPPDPDHEAVSEILDRFSRSGMLSFLAVIKEFGETVHGGLSFPRPGVTLAMDIPNVGRELMTLLDTLDEIVIAAGGRVYLGKDARLAKANFRRMYPGWEKWRDVRDRWDPDGVFQSDLGKRLGLVG